MFDFHEKRKIRNILYSKWIALALLFVTVLLGTAVHDRYMVAEEMRMKLEDKRSELEALKHRAQVLESKVEYLERDRGIEEELRNRFDVVREGEQMVILIGDREGEGEAVSETPSPERDSSFFDFLNFFNF